MSTPSVSTAVRRVDVAAWRSRLVRILSRHSIDLLRVALGLVFLGFGVLKFVPGLSPAEDLVIRTLDTLSFGMVPATVAVVLTATMETFIGLTLVSGRWLTAGLVVLGAAMVGILSPVVLFASEMFGDGPTLAAQYVLKDIVLVAAGLVVGAKALGARLVAPH
ncbi:MAG: DoxX family membrane protein [Nocardioidaceae bacterium]